MLESFDPGVRLKNSAEKMGDHTILSKRGGKIFRITMKLGESKRLDRQTVGELREAEGGDEEGRNCEKLRLSQD